MHGRREEPPGTAIARMVRDRGITDVKVLRAIAKFPRERFLPPETRAEAALDRAVSIGLDQTISQPYIVGVMTAELDLSGTERVLEVGTGSGYQAAILSVLAREVFTIERHATLSLRARGILDGLGVTNVRFAIGDGSMGLPDFAPFDRGRPDGRSCEAHDARVLGSAPRGSVSRQARGGPDRSRHRRDRVDP